jgi:hypothetical protein
VSPPSAQAAVTSLDFIDLIDRLLQANAISQTDYSLMKSNYDHFKQNRSLIEQQYPHRWVAALDNDIYSAASFRELQATLKPLPGSQYAYIVQLP